MIVAGEVEAVRRELQARGLDLPAEVVQAVADVFLADAAARVAMRRFRIASGP